MLNINTGILVYFSVSEVIDNVARESLYKMKVFCCFQWFGLFT